MKCPHCLVEFHDDPKITRLGQDVDGDWVIVTQKCPNPSCKRFIFNLLNGEGATINGIWNIVKAKKIILVHPKGLNRPPIPEEVPNEYGEDYREACLVLTESPKASAALSRRCLQHLLRDIAKVKPGNLVDEIQEVIDNGKLPSHLVESIDAIRNIGNFAAHPIKSQKTGEIVPVEPGEAEWNLDVLDSLFDFYFVQPLVIKKKRDALDAKLRDAGKKEMK